MFNCEATIMRIHFYSVIGKGFLRFYLSTIYYKVVKLKNYCLVCILRVHFYSVIVNWFFKSVLENDLLQISETKTVLLYSVASIMGAHFYSVIVNGLFQCVLVNDLLQSCALLFYSVASIMGAHFYSVTVIFLRVSLWMIYYRVVHNCFTVLQLLPVHIFTV